MLSEKDNQVTLITMSVGMSMKSWIKAGIIQRELAYYKALSTHVGRLCFLTYAQHLPSEKKILNHFIPDASIVCRNSRFFSRVPSGYFMASFIPHLNNNTFKSIHLVRSNQISGSWSGLSIARQKKIPFILRCGYLLSKNIQLVYPSSALKKNMMRALEKWVAKNANAIIVTYSGAKKYLIDHYDIQPEKITVIGNPIDIHLFSPKNALSQTKRDILFIGRFTPEKNIHSILLACQQSKASITLLGKGPLKQEMIEYARSLNLNANFIDYMPNSEIPKLMSNHRLFIIASYFEGNPKALLEAMSCEMPCIASQIPEHKELIVHEKDGLLAPHDAEGLSKAIHIGLNNLSFCDALGKNARIKILQDFSMNSNALKEYSLHQKVLMNYYNHTQ